MIGATVAAGQGPYAGHRTTEGRFTIIAEPRDALLAKSLLASISRNDTFPGLPRPRDSVLIVIAPDHRRFTEYAGGSAPEWGSAFAFPAQRTIVMQGSAAGADAGNPLVAVRHELAHLALHEALGDLPPRWFDEGYASFSAGEWSRDQTIATNVALALRGMPSLDSLNAGMTEGASQAAAAYALAYLAVADLAALDPQHGLSLLFTYWAETGTLDGAVRRAFGITLSNFESRWRAQTRRRYGALAVFADLTLAMLLLLIVVAPLYVIRRQRDRERLNALRARDAAQEQREREAAIDALLHSIPPPGDSRTAGDEN